MTLITKALLAGVLVFFILYLFGWYVDQTPNVTEWQPFSRFLHATLTLFAVVMTFVIGSIK